MTEHLDDEETTQVSAELTDVLGGRYIIGHALGRGGAGVVFEVVHRASNVKRVAKVLRPSVRELVDLKEEFQSEATKLANLRHPNLVTVFEQSQLIEIPYFVMEFVTGEALDAAMAGLVRDFPRGRWVSELRKITLQLVDALAYLHAQTPRLLHLDLKPDNIFVTRDYRNHPRAILLDFGISRYTSTASAEVGATIVRGTFPMWPRSYMNALKKMTTPERTVFLMERQKLNPHLDLHLLGRTLALAVEAGRQADPDLTKWSGSESAELAFLEQIADRLDIDKDMKPPFAGAAELRSSLRRLELRASRTRYHFDEGSLKLPGGNVSAFGLKARKLTDWPRYQRLRGVKQLGLTYLVYPGATHSRFEHSLAVFQNAMEVLDSISGPRGDQRFRSVVSDEELVGTALVALFHDLGHYPFAHQFRVAGAFPRHEVRTLEVLESDEVEKRVVEAFSRDIYVALLSLMKCVNAYEDPNPQPRDLAESQDPAHFKVLRAVVSGTIDVDKLDYVARDSLHAGVPYGNLIDRERFLGSLRVWWDKESTPHLLLSDKGRVCAESLVFARYLMTSEVYWNHGVRAYAAMLSAAIDQFSEEEVKGHLWDTDDQFMNWLGADSRSRWFTELVSSRRPYRRAFVHQQLGSGELAGETDRRLFDLLEKAVSEASKAHLKADISRVVASALSVTSKHAHEIVIDVPAGMARVAGIQVLPEGHEEPGRVGPIFDAIGENFDGVARKARIFVHPSLLENRRVAECTSLVGTALVKAFQLE